MAKREWIGEYWLNVEVYHSYKDEWIYEATSLGKCLCNDEACAKAVQTLSREYNDATIRDMYIVDGWGHIIYA